MAVAVAFDIGPILELMKGLEKQVPYATAVALTRIAQRAQEVLRGELPTDFVIRSTWLDKGIRITSAKKRDFVAGTMRSEVGSTDRFMALQAEGGKRDAKGSNGQAIPVGVRPTPQTRTPRGKWPGALLKRKGYFVGEVASGKIGVFRRLTRERYPIALQYWLKDGPVDVPPRWRFAKVVDELVAREGQLIAYDVLEQEVAKLLREAIAKAGTSGSGSLGDLRDRLSAARSIGPLQQALGKIRGGRKAYDPIL